MNRDNTGELIHIANTIENLFPLESQEEWDNSGFQIKLDRENVKTVLVAMEINDDVISEAENHDAQLIVTHHPLLFSPVKAIDEESVEGRYIVRLIHSGISVYSSHTPFDKCSGGNNDYLGKLLHLKDLALMEGDKSGICRAGYVDGDCSALEYIEQISRWLDIDKKYFTYTGNLEDNVRKVGLCTGAGAEFIELAKAEGCDLFITGDVKYHHAQLANAIKINLLDCGHFGTEFIFIKNMAEYLRKNIESDIIESGANKNPFIVF